MASRYRIAIIRDDGSRVTLHPGAKGERDFVKDIVTRTLAKGVGVLRTQAQVQARLEEALTEALYDLKSEVVVVV